MKLKKAIKQMKTLLLATDTVTVVELATQKLADGVTTIEAEAFEAGQSVFIITEDETSIPLPIGTYELEDGSTLEVVEEGLIDSITPADESSEEDDEEHPVEETKVEAAVIAEISKWELEVVNESFEVGDLVQYKPQEEGDEPINVQSGEYQLDDGRKVLIDGDAIIQMIKDAPAVEATVEEETVEEKMSTEEFSFSKESYDSLITRLESLETKLELSKTEVEGKDTKIEELKTELSKQPATTKINHNPEPIKNVVVKLKANATKAEKIRFYLNNN